ncbi:MAG: dihydrodipicolinate synthase family protein [Candidatus Eremiobacteraeota bacterium]|nr:dihydrodipicolinate synthase family protein [Candidatus Eremiobacteraeota bacterium]
MTPKGIWAAVVTPIDRSYSHDILRAVAYYRDLLQRGCDGINLLGTTGEAMSFSRDQRRRFMEAVAQRGLPMERVMAGTGAASLQDAVALTRCAFSNRFAAALVMPPFFFRDATGDGIVAFFDALFAQTNPPPKGVLLYNFPRMSGITFRPDLVDRLLAEFPGIVAGMKDSSNDGRLQSEVIARHPDFAVLPGSERDLLAAKRRGAFGCISGSVALWPELAQRVWSGGDDEASERLDAARTMLDAFPFNPAVRYLISRSQHDAAWESPMPPLRSLSKEQRAELDPAATTSMP